MTAATCSEAPAATPSGPLAAGVYQPLSLTPGAAGTVRLRSTSRRSAALLLVAGLLVAMGSAAWCRSRTGAAAPWAGSSPSFLTAQGGGRVCVLLHGVRVGDGAGHFKAMTAGSAEECAEGCQASPSCAQLIFSVPGGGCYTFEKAVPGLYVKVAYNPSDYSSAYCGKAEDSLKLETLRQEALDAAQQQGSGQVRQQWAAAEASARQLVATLSLESKMSLVHGSDGGMGYAGFLRHTGLPETVMPLKMQDGPQGFNPYQSVLAGTATQFPALLSVAASFDPEIARKYAAAVADEFVTKGANVLLGPDVEVTRATLTGRCFETISGEDPYLGSQLVGPYIKEIQARGIIATVKHWLDNNQEIYRQTMNAVVRERAQHEIYMPVFKAAFEAGAAAVMCSYNNVNGGHACENDHILKKLLREDLGFKGYVVSDWGATHDATNSARNGLDIEMPTGQYFDDLPALIANGTVQADALDEMATHVISSMYFAGQFEGRFPLDKAGALGHVPATTEEHRAVAFQTIVDSAVLLKNRDSTLPLATAGKTIALVGKYCNQSDDKSFSQGSVYSGGGSGYVITIRTITPLVGLKELVTDAASIIWSPDAAGAAGADVAVVCAAAHAEEGWDRSNLTLPEAEQLVAALRKQPGGRDQRIVVLAAVPGAVTTEWVKEADAVLVLFMPGEQVGPAVAQLLTGRAEPGGRLPVSLPRADEQRFTPYQYPGLCADNSWCLGLIANFSEDVLVGYRWNDAMKVPSAYPFGFGLSYTKFAFKDLAIHCNGNSVAVAFKISNVGPRDGTAVPQLYVGFPSLRPVLRQLRGFRKVHVGSGSEADVIVILHEEDWSFYDEAAGAWASAMKRGEEITVSVGASSTDLALSGKVPYARTHVVEMQ